MAISKDTALDQQELADRIAIVKRKFTPEAQAAATENYRPVEKKRRPWKLYGYLLLAILVISGIAYGYCNYTYGEGGYSGYVRMIHRVGAIKTWEGELDKRKLGGSYNKEDIFVFSIENETVAKKVQQAEQSGEWVTVHYREYLVALPWRGKTPIIVHDVTHADSTPEKPLAP